MRITRKPLQNGRVDEPHLNRSSSSYSQDASTYPTEKFQNLDLNSVKPVLPPRPNPSVEETALSIVTTLGGVESYDTTNSASSISASASTPDNTKSPGSTLSNASSSKKKTYQDVRHFAGGLVHHPTQSTKHFSILRHSHGLVFYQGLSTSIAISIFADAPLPADRTIWLQSKGWTGKTGMNARALTGWNGKWLDVTPATRVDPDQLEADDERAWQRDIANFSKRAKDSMRKNHKLRETAVVRIPTEARDGYYRLVLCTGAKRKVLCPSPVFRVLSTSTRPSSIRGAGLSTLPLEVGARILISTAKASAMTATGTAISPFTSVIQQQIQPYEPSWATRTAARVAYDVSGVSRKVDSIVQNPNSLNDEKRDQTSEKGVYDDSADHGPTAPFPILFTARVDTKSRVNEEFDISITYLTSVPEDILRLLNGYYFGWARNGGREDNQRPAPPKSDDYWHKMIISASSYNETGLSDNSTSGEDKKSIAIYLVQDDEEPITLDFQVEVQVMGFIRPQEQVTDQTDIAKLDVDDDQAEEAVLSAINDIEIAQAFLDQPAWAPQSPTGGKELGRPTFMDKAKSSLVDTKMSLQRRLDQVPLHKAGIRMPFDGFRAGGDDTAGIYVLR